MSDNDTRATSPTTSTVFYATAILRGGHKTVRAGAFFSFDDCKAYVEGRVREGSESEWYSDPEYAPTKHGWHERSHSH